ncbi:SNF2 family N-terminal domain-containing protein [Phascolomyces articulosus]|uniref:SNF2 family N-terminal domain-containing protein n=1 Tax=Phascolomyces articulosus TaxID=60185 RepID=A0AAD5PE27_9FUNG|nr:SNF2 family N-terminal domain-containing protein [Phascolomyces articulosus]
MSDQNRKRRFFDEDVEMMPARRIPRVEPAPDSDNDLDTTTDNTPTTETTMTMNSGPRRLESPASSQPEPMCMSPIRRTTPMEPKLQQFRDVVGEQVSQAELERLLNACRGDLQMAINAYFTRTMESLSTTTTTTTAAPASVSSSAIATRNNRNSTTTATATTKRYIGEWYIEGFSMWKGPSPVKEGDPVKIGRSKQAANSPTTYRRSRAGGVRRTAENIIVRFSTMEGREMGRLKASKTISKLLDLDMCHFEANIVICPPILQTGSDIVLRIQCYFTDKAFTTYDLYQKTPSSMVDKDKQQQRTVAAFDRSSETVEERLVQERTLAILELLRTISLKPTRSAMQRMNMKVGRNEEEARDQIAQSIATTSTAAQGREADEDEEEGESNGNEKKEVTNEQLDSIYEKAQMFDEQINPMDEPENMSLSLKPYQKRALAWMVHKESLDHEEDHRSMRAMHPLWEEYQFPNKNEDDEDMSFYFNPYTGQLSLEFPELESQERGGILADEMGLGKTIEMLSLIHQNKYVAGLYSLPADTTSSSPTTLVVCPMSLLAQWRDELIRGSKPNSIHVEVYYGDSRNAKLKEQLCKWDGSAPDVLITTYGVVLSDWNRSSDTLSNINFWRVILDEAHQIKNRLSKTSRACTALRAPRRWAVTGTPIQNKLEDLFALVRYLHHEPWSNYTFWRAFITMPFEKKDPRALTAVKTVLEPIVLRRTKDMRDIHGNPMVPLPPKQINIEYLRFSEPEQDIYDSLYTDSKTKFSHFCSAGQALANYASIFQLLMRLRQVACHPYLVLGNRGSGNIGEGSDSHIYTKDGGVTSLEDLMAKYNNKHSDKETYGSNVLQQLLIRQQGGEEQGEDGISEECPLCYEIVDIKLLLPCMHMYCRDCLMEYFQKKENAGLPYECPFCRAQVNQADVVQLTTTTTPDPSTPNNNNNATSSQTSSSTAVTAPKINVSQMIGGYKSSTKIDACLTHLKKNISEGHKTVVFSQFTQFLDLIGLALEREEIEYSRLDGSLSQAQREKVLASFSNSESTTSVLLISLRAGGVGLNLTCADRIIMMDPWWNFAVEAQAIDRVHRLGQEKPVIVTRFIMQDTVEERILEIQNKKHTLVNQLYKSKDDAKAQKMNDLQILFGTRSSG